MANNDSSSYTLRWNEVLEALEYSTGLMWTATGVSAGSGITQLTGDVIAGPGSGSQAATVVSVGGVSATNIANAVTTANNALPAGSFIAAGSAGEVQYNGVGNAFAASPNFTFDGTAVHVGLEILLDSSNSNITAGGLNLLSGTPGVTNTAITPLASSSSGGQSYSTYGWIAIDAASPTNAVSFIFDPAGNYSNNSGTNLVAIDYDNSLIVGANVNPATGAITNHDLSAILEVNSTTQGFLPPRMTTTQRTAITSPADGLIVYDTTLHQLWESQNSVWVPLVNGASLPLAGGTMTGAITEQKAAILNVSALATSGTVTPDGTLGPTFTIAVASAVTLNGPSSPVNGQKVTFRFINGASSAVVTLATGAGNFRFSTDIPSYVGTPSKTDYVGAIYNSTSSTWDVVAVIQGF